MGMGRTVTVVVFATMSVLIMVVCMVMMLPMQMGMRVRMARVLVTTVFIDRLAFDAALAFAATAYCTHYSTPSSLIFTSSPPVTCNW